ncbi:RNA polymerase subunit AC19 [Tulasnella sp. JGI-2019a]|nr:RNA polymerase subunit AC19 [Tulasnella sp. JGI-2019a]
MEFPSEPNNLPKISILKGATPDLSAATYCIQEETHTVGNALRWMLMKNPQVEFCGYSVPHPSEPKIHIRIQMYDNASSLDALIDALQNLDNLFESIDDAYTTSFHYRRYTRFSEVEEGDVPTPPSTLGPLKPL